MDEKFLEEQDLEHEDIITPSVSGFWSEKVFVITEDYEIKGYVFMPKTGKKSRVLSNILNSNKRFVAIKDAEISTRNPAKKQVESCNFIQLNLDSIILIRPCIEG